MRSRIVRRIARLVAPFCALALAFATSQCGLLGSPGEYGGGSEGADGGNEAATGDAPVTLDGNVVLPDGNVVPQSIGTVAVLAGERDPTSADDNPAWTADAMSGIVGADGRVASWRIEQSATLIGSFETGGVSDGRWFAINSGFGIAGGRATAIQSTAWGPGIAGDWKASRAPSPGGLEETSRVIFGNHVLFVGGTRTVTVDGGTVTFFTKEVHSADIDVAATSLSAPTNTTIELGLARSRPGVVFTGGHVYVVGGRFSGGITASVERTPIDLAAGGLGAFVDQPAMTNGGADHKIYGASLAAGEGYLFVAGGRTNGAGAPSDVVLASKIDATTGDLGEWTAVTKLPVELRDFGFVAFKKRLYVIGGVTANGGARTRDVLSAAINADGTLGAWDATNAKLPSPRSDFVALAY